jgi:CheY-specific phosphatase CheX
MNPSATEIIISEFESSLSDLIACYTDEVPGLVRAQIGDPSQTLVAIIGIGDAVFRASAVLLADKEVAVKLADSAPVNPTDWLGELSNQLVGRLKNKLSRYGLLPYLGTPVTISGREMDLGTVGTSPIVWNVTWSEGEIKAVFALDVAEDVELIADESAAVAEEGSVSLF